MYAEEREVLRKARREQMMRERKSRRRRAFLFCITLIVMFGIGVGFGTLLAKAEETEEETTYKYYTNIEIEKGDTLWKIADEYMDPAHYAGRSEYISEVMKINRMATDRLTAGKKIIVPYYSPEAR